MRLVPNTSECYHYLDVLLRYYKACKSDNLEKSQQLKIEHEKLAHTSIDFHDLDVSINNLLNTLNSDIIVNAWVDKYENYPVFNQYSTDKSIKSLITKYNPIMIYDGNKTIIEIEELKSFRIEKEGHISKLECVDIISDNIVDYIHNQLNNNVHIPPPKQYEEGKNFLNFEMVDTIIKMGECFKITGMPGRLGALHIKLYSPFSFTSKMQTYSIVRLAGYANIIKQYVPSVYPFDKLCNFMWDGYRIENIAFMSVVCPNMTKSTQSAIPTLISYILKDQIVNWAFCRHRLNFQNLFDKPIHENIRELFVCIFDNPYGTPNETTLLRFLDSYYGNNIISKADFLALACILPISYGLKYIIISSILSKFNKMSDVPPELKFSFETQLRLDDGLYFDSFRFYHTIENKFNTAISNHMKNNTYVKFNAHDEGKVMYWISRRLPMIL